MRIIISPAKKMNTDTDSLPWISLPEMLSSTREILDVMRQMDYEELKTLWKCNDQIATLNYERISTMDLDQNLTPAILAYEGIQYQYMAPGVFSRQELDYIQEKLRILSGFYGILRPFDGVNPYRLEMQAKLHIGSSKDLYQYWGSALSDRLCNETNCIINLASKEYSSVISKHIGKDIRFITCIFGEEKNGKIIEKGTMCKMARGEMVRFMAENHINSPEEIKSFNRLNYSFSDKHSSENTYVYIKKQQAK